MGNALRARPEDMGERYVRLLKGLQEAYGEAMLEFVPQISWHPWWERKRADALGAAGPEGRRRLSADDQAMPVVWGGRRASNEVL